VPGNVFPSGSGLADWPSLRRAAGDAAARAYAPYSGLHVGAAGYCRDGQVVIGCNVENASYGLTLCAECGLVSAVVAGGHGGLVAVSVVSGDGRPLPPCGRCRQVLMEFGGPELLLDAGEGNPPQRLADLLPQAFDGSGLARAAAKRASRRRGGAK
jgi:cytidine deaminase